MFSKNTDIFSKVDEYNPMTFERYDMNLSGPIAFLPKGSFFITGTHKTSDGWRYGKREHTPYDYYQFAGDEWNIAMTGDGKDVALNTSSSQKLMANVSMKPLDNTKLKYQFYGNVSEWQNYVHKWKYNPDGRYTYQNKDYMHALHFTQTISRNTFLTVKGSYKNHNHLHQNNHISNPPG